LGRLPKLRVFIETSVAVRRALVAVSLEY
jgi:hypothetical protein